MQVLIAISGFCPRIGNVPCTTPFDFLFVISIHVPTWGTTLSISTNLFALIFQSTFPRGERHGRGSGCTLRSYFNPRSLVGNDAPVISTTKFFEISIHVPSWGTTEMYGAGNLTILFQSTFPRGERPISERKKETALYISIHVPSWGTTV